MLFAGFLGSWLPLPFFARTQTHPHPHHQAQGKKKHPEKVKWFACNAACNALVVKDWRGQARVVNRETASGGKSWFHSYLKTSGMCSTEKYFKRIRITSHPPWFFSYSRLQGEWQGSASTCQDLTFQQGSTLGCVSKSLNVLCEREPPWREKQSPFQQLDGVWASLVLKLSLCDRIKLCFYR